MALTEPDNRFTKVYLTLWGICFLIGLLALIFYKFGYRLNNQLQPVKVGSIAISFNEKDSQVFLNNREQRAQSVGEKYLLKNIAPGLHSIVVSKDGYWPWTKTMAVSENNIRRLYAFMFPMNGLSTETLNANTAEFSQALLGLRGSVLPEPKPGSPELLPDESLAMWIDSNVPSRKLSFDKSTALYVEDNTVYVAWISDSEPPPHYFCEENPCKLKIPVIIPTDTIKSVDFYKERRDLIIFTSGSVIYGIETDKEGTQNFQPLYRGKDPYFYANDAGVLYIKDGNSILKSILY